MIDMQELLNKSQGDPKKVFEEAAKMMKGMEKPQRRKFEFRVIQGSIQRKELTEEQKQLKEAERIINGEETEEEIHAELVENESIKWVWEDLIVGAEKLEFGDVERSYLETTTGLYETPYTYEELNKLIEGVD